MRENVLNVSALGVVWLLLMLFHQFLHVITSCVSGQGNRIGHICGGSVWVCESQVVHHLVDTGLCCAPPNCIVHHQAALCTMGPMSMRSGGHPRHFSFFDGSKGTCKKQTLNEHTHVVHKGIV